MSKHWRELQDDSIREMVAANRRLKPLTNGQEAYFRAIETSTVTFCTGPAGTGKTYMACGIAVQMLKEKRCSRIVLTRPQVTCGKGVGFLPGDMREKISPLMRPMLDSFDDFLEPDELEDLIEHDIVELVAIDYLRGRSLKNAVIICDEAQNAEYVQLHMFLTRFGQNSRVIVNGDTYQSDLDDDGYELPLVEVIRKLKKVPAITHVQLTRKDIVRHELIQKIDELLSS